MHSPLQMVLKDKPNPIYHVSPTDSIHHCACEMSKHKVGAMLVMQQSEFVGIISERDMLEKVICRGLNPQQTQVANIMTREVIKVKPSMTVEQAMLMMTERRFRHLPVVENEQIIGVISIGDLTRWLSTKCYRQANEMEKLIGYINGV